MEDMIAIRVNWPHRTKKRCPQDLPYWKKAEGASIIIEHGLLFPGEMVPGWHLELARHSHKYLMEKLLTFHGGGYGP